LDDIGKDNINDNRNVDIVNNMLNNNNDKDPNLVIKNIVGMDNTKLAPDDAVNKVP
jgi:hypothetical protein